MDISNFLRELSAATGVPGGGAAAAVGGAMGCALFQMVAGVTLKSPRFTKGRDVLGEISQTAEKLHTKFLILANEDADAYRQVETAFRMPRSTSEEKNHRKNAIQQAFKGATETPLRTMATCIDAMALLPDLLKYGNPNAITDVAVGFLMLDASIHGASMNAEINLGSIQDEEFKSAANVKLSNITQQAADYKILLNADLKRAGLLKIKK